MKKCAFLTMDSLENFESYDMLLCNPFKQRGWSVDFVPWRKKYVDWNTYEVVIIRSPWDYHNAANQFLSVLEAIDHSSARLENNFDLIRWNIDKRYLRDLGEKGINIVPTLWHKHFGKSMFPGFFNSLNTDEIIIKPVISAGAEDTFRLSLTADDNKLITLEKLFLKRDFMVQPFMQNIINEGEFSLFFFGGAYSHAILKTPERQDFRVQEEHGGILKKMDPEATLIAHAQKVMAAIHPVPLYARVDSVRTDEGFALMELELIEPSLYFNMDSESPERFTRAFDRWMKNR